MFPFPLRFASLILAFAGLLGSSPAAQAIEGLITLPSAYPVDTTIERYETAARRRGFTVFARLDHAAAAAAAGLSMPRSTVIVFGNPVVGTPAFLSNPTLAVDLPLKALVWADASGRVYLSYNSADHIYGSIYPRHGIAVSREVLHRVETALGAIAAEAAN